MNPLQLIPDPYRMAAQALAVALVIAALISFGWSKGSEHVQTKWDAEKGRALAAQIVAEQTARAREQSMISQIRKAENDATERETKLRASAGAAHDAASSLRDDLATTRGQLSAATADACVAAAGAALELLGTCADEYRGVAAAADGHSSDAETLSDAWPE